MTHTDFYTKTINTIKYLPANFDDDHAKQDAKSKETIEETISEQDAKFYEKFEKKLQNLSLQIKEYSTKFSSKIYDQDKFFSSFTTSYD